MKSRNKVWCGYVVGLHIIIAVILVKSDFIELVGRKIGVYQPTEISDYYNIITTYHKRMDGSVPEGATIFIGDSITQGLATAAISEYSVNYGIGFDTTVGVINRLPFYKSVTTAKSIVIAIGVNDLKRRENSRIVKNYQKILNFIPKDKKIILSAVLPVDERVSSVKVSNKRILQLNSALKKMSTNYVNVIFINSSNMLQEPNGNLKSTFHTGDGVHLNTDGYRVWISLLRKALDNG
ncbi:N-Acetylneuraminate cytidylyltransferase [Moritella sp. JT01]|uniref:GDSL-type esterase/lipase family protein n=1 Tax=Moritella sp. JT01 TaxID=756698 RepID=UPI00079842C3|nr:GDSL-type esterase/lipase family protein [Moritella sp. JT01]KXO09164.1 N-Acetylneuraminate cytidylyltransferase [Moritella sp. JT01]